MRQSGIEPEEQDWKSGMLPLHHWHDFVREIQCLDCRT